MIPGRELPTARTVGWNAALLLVVGLSVFLTVFLADAPWSEVGLILGGGLTLGLLLAVVVTPISRRRFEAQRFAVAGPAAQANLARLTSGQPGQVGQAKTVGQVGQVPA